MIFVKKPPRYLTVKTVIFLRFTNERFVETLENCQNWICDVIIDELLVQNNKVYNGRYTRGSLLLKHTRATDFSLELAPSYQTSLIPGAKLGSRYAQHIFSLEIVGADEGALLRERVAGACCGSNLPRVYWP